MSRLDQLQSLDRDGFNPRHLTSLIAFRFASGWIQSPFDDADGRMIRLLPRCRIDFVRSVENKGAARCLVLDRFKPYSRHSGAMRSIEPGTQGQTMHLQPLGSGSRYASPE